MRRKNSITSVAALALCLGTIWTWAEETKKERPKPAQFVNDRFEAAAPAVGEVVPNVRLHDAQGQEIWLHDALRGHYSVLVLGCLT